MKTEPVLSAQGIAAGVSTAIMAFLAMLVSIHIITLDPSQMDSIQAFVTALGALAVIVVPQLIAALWARKQVVPVSQIPQLIAMAQQGDVYPYTGAEL